MLIERLKNGSENSLVATRSGRIIPTLLLLVGKSSFGGAISSLIVRRQSFDMPKDFTPNPYRTTTFPDSEAPEAVEIL
jgi:hypothetical protein